MYIDLGVLELKQPKVSNSKFAYGLNVTFLVLSIINNLTVIAFYYRRRNYQPLKSRSVTLVLRTIIINGTLAILSLLKIVAVRNNLNCVLYHLIFSILAPCKF